MLKPISLDGRFPLHFAPGILRIIIFTVLFLYSLTVPYFYFKLLHVSASKKKRGDFYFQWELSGLHKG